MSEANRSWVHAVCGDRLRADEDHDDDLVSLVRGLAGDAAIVVDGAAIIRWIGSDVAQVDHSVDDIRRVVRRQAIQGRRRVVRARCREATQRQVDTVTTTCLGDRPAMFPQVDVRVAHRSARMVHLDQNVVAVPGGCLNLRERKEQSSGGDADIHRWSPRCRAVEASVGGGHDSRFRIAKGVPTTSQSAECGADGNQGEVVGSAGLQHGLVRRLHERERVDERSHQLAPSRVT